MQQILLNCELSSTVPAGREGAGEEENKESYWHIPEQKLVTLLGLPLVYLCDSMITWKRRSCLTKCGYIHTTPLNMNDPEEARRYNIMK